MPQRRLPQRRLPGRLAAPALGLASLVLCSCDPGGATRASDGGGTSGFSFNPSDGGVVVPGGGIEMVITAGDAGAAPPKAACPGGNTTVDPYAPGYTPDPVIREAAMSLASSMSNDEKAQQMRGLTLSTPNYDVFKQENNTARGIRAFFFRDGPRGVNLNANADGRADYSTAFPVAIARAAAFDLNLEWRVGEAIGDETLASGNTMLLAPTVNILRHPQWGRAQETYGEDPYQLGRLGSAFVAGVQQHIAACVKHYAANNIENRRSSAIASMDEQTLREIYARHFEMIAKDGGVSCVMASYNSVVVPGAPAMPDAHSTQNRHLLTDILRTDFGFQGFVLSDWWAMPNGNNLDNLTSNAAALRAKAAEAVNAGLDMELPWSYNYSQLTGLVADNTLSASQLVTSASLILEQKMRFKVDGLNSPIGLYPPTTTFNRNTSSIDGNEAHVALAEEAARKSMVLLKNENHTLPIDRSAVTKIAVLGARVSYDVSVMSPENGSLDFATNVRTGDLGSSRVFADPAKSVGPLAGIKEAAGSAITVTAGNAASAASDADFIVVVAGLTPFDEGEEYTRAGDRSNMRLDGKDAATSAASVQENLIRSAAALGKPMVVVLEGGSVIDMTGWLSSAPAVVMAWYPGMAGGRALGKLLFGDENFGGKLPITWPAAASDLPAFTGASLTTTMDYYIGYRRFDNLAIAPLYPFGHGLSYTTFSLSNLNVPCTDVPKDGVVNVQVDVANTGALKGDQVVLLFVSFPDTTARRPTKELKGFYRVSLEAKGTAGDAKRITIPLRVADLKYWDSTLGRWVVETGTVRVMVGTSAAAADLTLSDTFAVR
jgi:beta-glucosidase